MLEPARRTDSDLLQVDLYLGRSLALLGRLAEAVPLLERRRQRLVDPAAGPEPWVAWAYVALGRRADAEALAVKYHHLPFRRAIINGALGRDERMFNGLEEMAEREPQRRHTCCAHPSWSATVGTRASASSSSGCGWTGPGGERRSPGRGLSMMRRSSEFRRRCRKDSS